MYKIGAVVILVIAAFFYGRSTGIDKVTIKCQAKDIKQAQEVNDVQQEVISKRPLNSNSLIDRLRARAKAKREN
jgi:hypothetical protein